MKTQEFKPRYHLKIPNFWDGIDSLFDLYHAKRHNIERNIKYSSRKDYDDIKSDFEGVGHDLNKAIEEMKRQYNL